jgi:hypothetical protein
LELRDGHWSIVLPDATPSSPIMARIHDAMSLPPTNHNPGYDLQLSDMLDNEQRYWCLPTEITPILTYLLYNVTHLNGSNIEELQLAIELCSLLALRSLENQGPLSSPGGGPGRNPDVGSKQGHDGGLGGSGARKRGRRNPPHLAKGARDSIQAGELLISSDIDFSV